MKKSDSTKNKLLTPRETEFIKLCYELTYKEIAVRMFKSSRINDYRDDLFEKLNLKSRTGLVMFTVDAGIVTQYSFHQERA